VRNRGKSSPEWWPVSGDPYSGNFNLRPLQSNWTGAKSGRDVLGIVGQETMDKFDQNSFQLRKDVKMREAAPPLPLAHTGCTASRE
jgi:hypothetical protein